MAGGAPRGNKNAIKLATPELKQEAYKDYCAHIASGRSKEGWRYKDKDKLLCTYKTMEAWIKENPVDFPVINKEIAETESFNVWESKGWSMMEGESKAETALYQMFMRNKFGWDKKDRDDSEHIDYGAIEKLAAFFKAISSSAAKDKE